MLSIYPSSPSKAPAWSQEVIADTQLKSPAKPALPRPIFTPPPSPSPKSARKRPANTDVLNEDQSPLKKLMPIPFSPSSPVKVSPSSPVKALAGKRNAEDRSSSPEESPAKERKLWQSPRGSLASRFDASPSQKTKINFDEEEKFNDEENGSYNGWETLLKMPVIQRTTREGGLTMESLSITALSNGLEEERRIGKVGKAASRCLFTNLEDEMPPLPSQPFVSSQQQKNQAAPLFAPDLAAFSEYGHIKTPGPRVPDTPNARGRNKEKTGFSLVARRALRALANGNIQSKSGTRATFACGPDIANGRGQHMTVHRIREGCAPLFAGYSNSKLLIKFYQENLIETTYSSKLESYFNHSIAQYLKLVSLGFPVSKILNQAMAKMDGFFIVEEIEAELPDWAGINVAEIPDNHPLLQLKRMFQFAYDHKMNLDLRKDNIRMTSEGILKLADFMEHKEDIEGEGNAFVFILPECLETCAEGNKEIYDFLKPNMGKV